jgi:hypothetical protein
LTGDAGNLALMADRGSNPENMTGIDERKSCQVKTPARLFQYGGGGGGGGVVNVGNGIAKVVLCLRLRAG